VSGPWSRRLEVSAIVLAVAVGFALLPIAEAFAAAGLALAAGVVAAVDRHRFLIPDAASAAIALGGLAVAIGLGDRPMLDAALDAVARGLAAGLFLWTIRAVYRWLRGHDGLGLGDVGLAAAAAPWLDWWMLLPAFEAAVAAALIAVAIDALVTRRRPEAADALPFGLFLAPACWLGFLVERSPVLAALFDRS
jgi:leader peptidase (prepilin peptidase) / N-methyltransferase